jgi:hypothetical protein
LGQIVSKLNKLIEICKKFASASTIIGLTRIDRAKTRFMKIIWVLMTLISLAFGLYLTSETIKDYLQYDVFTTIKHIQATSILLPSVTFCFIGPESKNLTAFFHNASFVKDEKDSMVFTDLTSEQFSDEIMVNWEGSDCIKFNHFTNKSESGLFTAEGLADYLSFQIDLNVKFSSLFVFLSDNHDNILDSSQYVTTSYNVKGDYDIAYKKEVEYKLGEPYNQCQNVSDLTYRQTNCLAQCKNENFERYYNCTPRNYYSTPGYSFCNSKVLLSSEFDAVCKEKCSKECTTIKFNTLVSNPQLNPSSPEKLKFIVWPLDLNYIEISQTPKMSGFSLMNEIGGALGLFVGITCLSLLEFFELFLIFYK